MLCIYTVKVMIYDTITDLFLKEADMPEMKPIIHSIWTRKWVQ